TRLLDRSARRRGPGISRRDGPDVTSAPGEKSAAEHSAEAALTAAVEQSWTDATGWDARPMTADHAPEIETESAAAPTGDAADWLTAHGDALYRFARLRVGARGPAEDLVQDTFLAAIAARGRFRGRSSTRTWLLGILRRKIADHYRR